MLNSPVLNMLYGKNGQVLSLYKQSVHKAGTCRVTLLLGLPQGLQVLLMSGVSVTSASQILESFWNIWSQVSQ